MSVSRERKRRRITLILGVLAALTFGGIYGIVVNEGAIGSTTSVASVQAAPATSTSTQTATSTANITSSSGTTATKTTTQTTTNTVHTRTRAS